MTSDSTSEPWGHYSPNRLQRRTIEVCRSLPSSRLGKYLAVLLRRPIKYGADTPLDVQVWGLKMRLHRRGNFSESALLFTPQFFDPYERDALRKQAQKGWIFLDLGANAGAYSFWVHSLLGDACRIVAVEPDPEIYRRFAFNVSANEAQCIRPLNLALDDHGGKRTLFINPRRRGQNSLLGIPDSPDALRSEEVEVKTLLQVLQDEDIDRVDAMKIDIEGMEYAVLGAFFAKAEPTLWPRLLLMEFKETKEHRLLRTELGQRGYEALGETKENLILELRSRSGPT